jgi:hypothetical protein
MLGKKYNVSSRRIYLQDLISSIAMMPTGKSASNKIKRIVFDSYSHW